MVQADRRRPLAGLDQPRPGVARDRPGITTSRVPTPRAVARTASRLPTAGPNAGDPAGQLGHGGRRRSGRSDRRRDKLGRDGLGTVGRQQGRHPGGRAGDAAPGQPSAEDLLGPRQPATDRPRRTPEGPGRLLVRLPFDQAEGDRGPVPVAEAVQLLVQHRPDVGPVHLVQWVEIRHRPGPPIPLPLAGGPDEGLLRHPQRHPVQPARDRLAAADPPGLPGEDHEGRLEGILRVRVVAEDPPADPPDQGPVPADQGRERVLVPAGQVAAQEVGVR